MVRRALLTIFPAVLAALAILDGTPIADLTAARVSATSWRAEAISAPVVTGNVATDVADSVISPAVDDDHHDTPVVRRVISVVWPDSAFADRVLCASDRIEPSHRPCAAEPRAPPTA
jgi:hypothetical protein